MRSFQQRIATRFTLLHYTRHFHSDDRFGRELGFAHKMRDIPVLTGNPRPVQRETGWTCEYRLTDKMDLVIPEILKKNGWSDVEIDREMSQFHLRRRGSRASLHTWNTVEEFQRTPWYRRFRPTDDLPALFISYEAMKLLETTLIPPSLRSDPYAHLRKRHLEDNWMNDRFTEENAKYVTKEDLAKQTKGTDSYGTVTRKQFMEFDKKFSKVHGGKMQVNETYQAWMRTMKEGN